MPVKQLLTSNIGPLLSPGVTTKYVSVTCTSPDVGVTSDEAGVGRVRVPWMAAGAFSKLRAEVTAPTLTPGQSISLTFRVNGVNSALSVTVTSTGAVVSDPTHSVVVAVEDEVDLELVIVGGISMTNLRLRYAMEFDSTAIGQSSYATAWGAPSGTSPGGGRNSVFRISSTSFSVAHRSQSLAACDGTLTGYRVVINGSPGAGKSWQFVIYKNDVKQDGSGGTVDTRGTIADASTSVTASFALPIAAGDTVYFENISAGSPSATGRRFSVGFGFTATTDGQSHFCGRTLFPSPTPVVATAYTLPVVGVDVWTTTETDAEMLGGISTFVFSRMRVELISALSNTGPATFTTRLNQTSPVGTPTTVIGAASSSGSDLVGELRIAQGDVFSLQSTKQIASRWAWCLVGVSCTCPPRPEYGGGFGYTACCGPTVEGGDPFAAPPAWIATCDGAGSTPDGINGSDAENWAE